MHIYYHKLEELLKEQMSGPWNAMSRIILPSRNPLPSLTGIRDACIWGYLFTSTAQWVDIP